MYSVGELVGAELVGAELVGLFVGDAEGDEDGHGEPKRVPVVAVAQ